MKTSTALGVSVAMHAVLAAVVLHGAATKARVTEVPHPLAVATRVTLFPRPVERTVARAEAPPRRLRTVAAKTAGLEEAPPADPVAEPASAPSGASGTEPVAAESTTPAAGPASPSPAGRALDVAGLHAALAASAQRCYPAAARRFNLAGEVTVDFCLDARGALQSVKLDGSTGQSLLDVAARECVVAGAMPLPADAFGGCFAVPVRFGRP